MSFTFIQFKKIRYILNLILHNQSILHQYKKNQNLVQTNPIHLLKSLKKFHKRIIFKIVCETRTKILLKIFFKNKKIHAKNILH